MVKLLYGISFSDSAIPIMAHMGRADCPTLQNSRLVIEEKSNLKQHVKMLDSGLFESESTCRVGHSTQ